FDAGLAAALPQSFRGGWQTLGSTGRYDIDLEHLRFSPAYGGATQFSWDGTMMLHDAGLRLGLDVSHINGTVSGGGSWTPESGIAFDGKATMDRAVLGTFDLRRMAFDAFVPRGRQTLMLRKCEAELFGGTASGDCDIIFGAGDPSYTLTMSFQGAELEQYARAVRRLGDQRSSPHGLMYGKFFMKGRSGRPDLDRGGGELFLREAQVWKLPLVFEIFRLLNLAPDENMFHDGWLKFFIEGRTMHLTKIDLQGKAISLVGSGTMKLDTDELDVRLLAGSPTRLRVPIVTELVAGA